MLNTPEKVAELCGRVNLRLPRILALSSDCEGHNVISVLCRKEIGSLEEDAGAVRPWCGGPRFSGSQRSVNGGIDIGFARVGIASNRTLVRWILLCEYVGGRNLSDISIFTSA